MQGGHWALTRRAGRRSTIGWRGSAESVIRGPWTGPADGTGGDEEPDRDAGNVRSMPNPGAVACRELKACGEEGTGRDAIVPTKLASAKQEISFEAV